MENMPCPNTLGCPACWAATSSWCIGLKSPDAPAYFTRSVRVSGCVITGASSPTCTSSKDSFFSPIVTTSLGPVDQVEAGRPHRLARRLVAPVGLRADEGPRPPLGLLLVGVGDGTFADEHVAHLHRAVVEELLLAVQDQAALRHERPHGGE